MHVSGQTLGPPTNVQNKTVTLSNAHSKKFTDAFGFVNNYGEVHFTVQPGQDRLSASIAYPAPYAELQRGGPVRPDQPQGQARHSVRTAGHEQLHPG